MGVYRQRNVAHHKCHAHLMDVSGERHLASCSWADWLYDFTFDTHEGCVQTILKSQSQKDPSSGVFYSIGHIASLRHFP